MKALTLLSRSIIPLSLILLFACEPPAPEASPNTFSGNISNGEVDTIYLFNEEVTIKLAVDSGLFADTINPTEGYYTLRIGRESTAMYWDSAFQISLDIDLEQFDESVTYAGFGAAENNVLAKSYLVMEEQTGKALFSKEEDAFIESLKMLHKDLQALVEDPHGSATFKEEQKANADYYFNSYLFSYPSYHKYYMAKDSFEVSSSYYENLIPFEKDLQETFDRSASYRELLNSYIQFNIRELGGNEGSFGTALKAALKEFKSDNIKNSILKQYSYQLLKPNEDLEENYQLLKNELSDSEAIEKYTEAYTSLKKILKGMPSPSFEDYENHAGGKMSLSDLKGKYVYVDVWATWCGPCIREIPSLKKIEAEYHDANIQFLSISIDQAKDHETWVKMVNKKELSGIQLFADSDWKSAFVENYYIKGIPRFILIDPEGNIVDADAPRPSDPKLQKLFEELKIANS